MQKCGGDWKLYDSNEKYLGYYDAQNITRQSKNIVRVWLRWNWTEKGVLWWVRDFGKKYENLSYSIILQEINCVEKKTRFLLSTDYDNKGGAILSSSSPSEWEFIVPDSMTEGLYKEVCK